MKTLLSLLTAIFALAGCVAVPVPVAPRAYVAPYPPVVVVRPYAYYGYGHRYWR